MHEATKRTTRTPAARGLTARRTTTAGPEFLPDLGSDAGFSRPIVTATLVGIMIVASVVALLLGLRDDKKTTSASQRQAAATVSPSPVPTTSSATSSAAPSTPVTTPAVTTNATTAPAAKNTTAPSSSAKPATVKPVAAKPTPSRAKSITYTVKRGDNLTVIAAWFHQHGYGRLYDLNKSVIGNNPDLIYPGQRITVSRGGMTVG